MGPFGNQYLLIIVGKQSTPAEPVDELNGQNLQCGLDLQQGR
jgi:hypothetical protein